MVVIMIVTETAMTTDEIKEMVDSVEAYVNTANTASISGRIFNLAVKVEKYNDTEARLEAALITALLEEKS